MYRPKGKEPPRAYLIPTFGMPAFTHKFMVDAVRSAIHDFLYREFGWQLARSPLVRINLQVGF